MTASRIAATRCSSLAACVALALVAAQTTPPEGALFGRAPLPKGVRLVATSSNEQNVKSMVKGGGIEQAVDGTTRVEFGWSVAVTAADEKGVQAATIEVTRAHVHVTGPLGEQDDESSVAGRSFEATRTVGGFGFAGKEAPAPDDEAKTTLRAIATRALEPAPIAATLDGRRLAVGETLKLSPDDAKRLLATFAESWSVTSLELKLAALDPKGRAEGNVAKGGATAETARFTVTATLTASGAATAGADATLELSGELVVATANSLLLRASLSGPIKIDGRIGDGAAAVTIQGTGEAKWSFAADLK